MQRSCLLSAGRRADDATTVVDAAGQTQRKGGRRQRRSI
jgi:hypothetical protein